MSVRSATAKPPLVLLIVRHAESCFNTENRIQGHCDSDLTGKGRRQAKALAGRFAGLRIKKVYSSDLGRTMSTTRFVAKKLGQPIVREPRLREIMLGHWEGLTPDEVNCKFRNGYNLWRKSPSKMKVPGGESILRFHSRVRRIFDDIIAKEKTGTLLIVTHGGVIASILTHWLNSDFDRILLSLKLDNTGVTVAEARHGKVTLHAINDISHLQNGKLNELDVFA